MKLQLPRPMHGWRALAGEIGIIVVGVLLALGAQQLVESANDREAVSQLRAGIRAELADDRARWEYMRSADRCALRRLDLIERWLATAPGGARIADPHALILLNLHTSSWDLAKTSAVTAKFPLRERLTYASLFAALENWRELIRIEEANRQLLSALLETANVPGNRAQIPLVAARARIMVHFREASFAYLIQRFDELRIRPDASTLASAADPNELCRPLAG